MDLDLNFLKFWFLKIVYFGFWYQILRFLYCLDLEQSSQDRLPESLGNGDGEGYLKKFFFGVIRGQADHPGEARRRQGFIPL